MRLKILLSIFFVVLAAYLQTRAGNEVVVEGDKLDKVYTLYGSPRLEFPLGTTLVQHYDHSIIKSRDGVVFHIQRLKAPLMKESGAAAESNDASAGLSVEGVRVKAEMGDAESQYYMGYWSQTGQHIAQDKQTALIWYSKAAHQGHMAAQHNLGVIYMKGDGVDKDLESAYVWALLAADHGNETLKKALSRSLSADQRLASTIRADQIRIGFKSTDKTSKTSKP
jgi:hypothetical protein